MKAKPFFILTCTLAVAAGMLSCHRETVAPLHNEPNVRTLTAREAQTVTTTNDFAFRLFKKMNAQEEGQNLFISPFSVATALTMAYNGAATSTKTEIRNTLGLGDATDAEVNGSYQSLYQLLTGIDKTTTFTSANSVWYRNSLQPRASFVETNKTYLSARVEGLDFTSPDAVTKINNWVSGQTGGRITEMVNQLRPEHVMILLNAVYFKGTWAYKFDKNLTRPGAFHLADGATVQHPFMELSGAKYLLHHDNTHTLVDLPYGNKQFSMTLIMPGEAAAVDQLVGQLTPATVTEWLAEADTSNLKLFLPKFKLEYEQKLNQTLIDLGMPEAFTNEADFSGLLEGFRKGDLTISEVKHKSYVEVDEAGTEAAAATSIGIVVTSLPPSIRFDRPFVFLIREKASGAVLFMGKLAQPQ